MTAYIYDQAWEREHERLEAIASTYDEGTRYHIGALGLSSGWRCLEVGAGAGSIARWLAEEVAPGGRIVATDLDPRYLDSSGVDNLEVRAHDVTRDPIEPDTYDLAHARMLLQHIPQREEVIERLVEALRPGGWLLLEEVDFAGPMAEAIARYVSRVNMQSAYLDVVRAFDRAMAAAGTDNAFGTRLPALMRSAGLVDIGGQLRAPLMVTQPGRPDWGRLSLLQVRSALVEAGLLDDAIADAYLRASNDEGESALTVPLMAVWGRRPG